MRSTSGDLNVDAITQKVTTVHFVTSVIGISVVVKFHEAESILQRDFANPAKLAEKTFHILFASTMV